MSEESDYQTNKKETEFRRLKCAPGQLHSLAVTAASTYADRGARSVWAQLAFVAFDANECPQRGRWILFFSTFRRVSILIAAEHDNRSCAFYIPTILQLYDEQCVLASPFELILPVTRCSASHHWTFLRSGLIDRDRNTTWLDKLTSVRVISWSQRGDADVDLSSSSVECTRDFTADDANRCCKQYISSVLVSGFSWRRYYRQEFGGAWSS